MDHLAQNEKATIEFGEQFDVLGPFRIGTRGTFSSIQRSKVVWGADPLERIGGFQTLSYDEHARFDSPLGRNGNVYWQKLLAYSNLELNPPQTAMATLSITFQSHQAEFPSTVYGWAALQYQAWARGWLINHSSSAQTVELFTDGVWEYTVNGDKVFGGDLYGFRRAPLVLTLRPGPNQIDLRIYRDVRAFGGAAEQPVLVHLEARELDASPLVEDPVLISDKVDGKVPSPYASIIFRNADSNNIQVESVEAMQGLKAIKILDSRKITVYPGQSRPVNLVLQIASAEDSNIAFALRWRTTEHPGNPETGFKILTVRAELETRSIFEPHKFTFLNASKAVSYAILRPPNITESLEQKREPLPIMLNLHGAGVDVDSLQMRHSLDEVPDLKAWALFPQAGSYWSADDFRMHRASFCFDCISTDFVSKTPGALQKSGRLSMLFHHGLTLWIGKARKWISIVGYWFAISHYPDKVIAGAPVSAYTSIENYVPYVFKHEMEPIVSSILHAARMSFKHELLVENLRGIPILAQHGSSDDNVPVYHSRLMKSLIHETSAEATYVELPGKGHWFDGVMTTEDLKAFYRAALNTKTLQKQLPIDFTIVVADSDDFGTKGGLGIDQVVSPARLASISVHRNVSQASWHLRTSNVHRFHIDTSTISVLKPHQLILDGGKEIALGSLEFAMCVRVDDVNDNDWKRLDQRYGRQRGALDAILRSSGHFHISYASPPELNIALQISRNLFQYFTADSEIVSRHRRALNINPGNSILVACGTDIVGDQPNTPSAIQLHEHSICLKGVATVPSRCYPFESGLGAIFLRPLDDERLELVVWGYDIDGLQQAARLAPTVTGVGQPDFIITTAECRWRGAAGIAAAGFFTHNWQIAAESYYR
ncbi:MAG: hypothetical protein Q9160_005175 [Pyrenula sp. 1 TL-2023]